MPPAAVDPGAIIRCIYCREVLGPDTALAHVIPGALGGRVAARTVCCTGCNNAISPVENELCGALRYVSAALGARDDENRLIRAEVESGGKKYDYADGIGDEVLPPPRYHGSGLAFALPGGLEAQAEVIAKRLWAAGLTPNALDDGTFRIEPDNTFGVRPHPPRPAVLRSVLAIGTTPHMRVVMKMALELLAYRRPDDARRWAPLYGARRYIRWGEGEGLPARFEAVSTGAGVFTQGELPPLAHAVEVWTHRSNLLYRVTLFGGLHVTGPLTTAWDGPALTVAHALDPRHPGHHVDRYADADGPPLPVYHPEQKEQAFARFAAWIMDRTLEIAGDAGKRPWQPPGELDLDRLRPIVEAKFAELLKRKRQPRRRRRETSRK